MGVRGVSPRHGPRRPEAPRRRRRFCAFRVQFKRFSNDFYHISAALHSALERSRYHRAQGRRQRPALHARGEVEYYTRCTVWGSVQLYVCTCTYTCGEGGGGVGGGGVGGGAVDVHGGLRCHKGSTVTAATRCLVQHGSARESIYRRARRPHRLTGLHT